MKKIAQKLTATALAGCLAIGLAGCGGDSSSEKKIYDNESDPLRFSTSEVDRVFNPFYSTSLPDSNVVGMTQLSMISNDANGKPVYGDDKDTYVRDLEIVHEGKKISESEDTRETTYYFVLKNNVKFSNGSPVTIKDVLFNLYVYLDMAYTGSSTIYSTDIVGLQEYRTQETDKTEQEGFMHQFEVAANNRITALLSAYAEIKDDPEYKDKDLSIDELYDLLEEKSKGTNEAYKNIAKDFDSAVKLFKEELETDYSNSVDSYQDIVFKDEDDKEYKGLFTTDVEVFLYNEGKITWNKKDKKLECSYTTDENVGTVKSWTKTQAINRVFDDYMPDKLEEVVTYWNTSVKLAEQIKNEELEAASGNMKRDVKSIEGIKFANGGKDRGGADTVTVNGTAYPTPTYNSDGSVATGYEVLSIKIDGVDPKAIWNFSFPVAPMYYYSDDAHIRAFDYVENFGVQWNSQNFMTNVIKNSDKLGVPVGAGPYMASKESGGTTGVGRDDFYNKGVIYYERNPHYIKPVKIKKVRFVVVASTQMTNALYTNVVDFSEPNAKPETEQEILGKNGYDCKSVQTSGYGYIGINAGKIPYLNVRRAIMYSIDTSLCIDYYKNTAEALYRSISKSSPVSDGWDATAYYPYIGGKVPENLDVVDPAYKAYVNKRNKKAGDTFTEAEQKEFIKTLMENPNSLDSKSYKTNSKYKLSLSNGVYTKGNHTCRYIFTIAGEVTDHPAWQALYMSSRFLNECGFDITVKTDANALSKLNSGALTVWAAAWSATIDPDMYQVYHKDSTATSVLNWGYPAIKRNSTGVYEQEVSMLNRLADLIEKGRDDEDMEKRIPIYREALNKVMELAVELPTYQRNDLFAYNETKIDKNSFCKDVSAFKSLTSEMYNLSLVTAEVA